MRGAAWQRWRGRRSTGGGSSPRALVPGGPGSQPWQTQQPSHTVLAIVHNVTSASRLADVLPALNSDPRVQIVFTTIGSSAFTRGVDALLSELEVIVMPWAEATSREFDLAVATSHGGDLSAIRAPLAIFPHGMGYNKYLSPGTSRDIQGHPGWPGCSDYRSRG